MHSIKNWFLLLFIFVSASFNAQQMPLSKAAKISILTCEKGNELYSLFGHTAIRVKDEASNLDIVYNYGTFDFRTENFYLKFIKGNLQYFVSAYPYSDFYEEYVQENRSIYEQVLRISAPQKQQLFDALNTTLFSDEKYYTYKFIDRNCTTMVVDKVNETLGEKCVVKTTNLDQTYREILFPYLETHFYENLGINIIFGEKVDRKGDILFLPDEFMESLKTAKSNQLLLAENPITLLQSQKIIFPKSLWNNYFTFCIALILLVISRKKWLYSVYFIFTGLLGIFLLTVGFYSFHEELLFNYNSLLFNPSLLFVVYFFYKKNYKWLKYSVIINFLCLFIYLILLFNKPNFTQFIPMILSSFVILIAFYRFEKEKRNGIPIQKKSSE
jgi:hypothetical protein